MLNEYKDTFIIRDAKEGSGYDAFRRLADGREFYWHSIVVGGPVSKHYIISNAGHESGIQTIISHEGVAHSKEEAFDKAHEIIKNHHKDSNIIDKTSRAKESKLMKKARTKKDSIPELFSRCSYPTPTL